MAIKGAIPVQFGDVFPHGAYAMGVEPLRDFDKSTRENPVQARDKTTSELLWAVDVIDADPESREKQVRMKVTAPHQPVLPEAVSGVPFRPVEFDGMTITPYVNGRGRISYSVRATQMHAPKVGARPQTPPAKESGSERGKEAAA
ncbi:MAG: hypothetical protein ACRDQA_08705 [Nocardioidaceae bacterium]